MKNEEIKNKKYSLSKIISYVCEAPFLAIPTFLIINLALNQKNFLIIQIISLFFATILPIFLISLWSKMKNVDRDYTVKETRNYVLLIGTTIYFIGALTLWFLSANPLTLALMFCYGMNTFIVFLINLRWKISVHSMGLTGPTTALMFLNPWFFILGLIGPLIMWSRITLKKHTLGQVLAGSFLGYILTAIQLYYLIWLMNFNLNVDLYLIFLIILGLTLPPLFLFLSSYLNDTRVCEGHIRKIFYFLAFASTLVFLIFSPVIPFAAFILSGIVSIVIIFFGGLDFQAERLKN